MLQVRVSRNYRKQKQPKQRSPASGVTQTPDKRVTLADRKKALKQSGILGKPRGKAKPATATPAAKPAVKPAAKLAAPDAEKEEGAEIPKPATAKPAAKPDAPEGREEKEGDEPAAKSPTKKQKRGTEQKTPVQEDKMYVYVLHPKLVYMVY